MVVESAQSSSPFYSHIEKVYNVRHYYIAIDLSAKGSLLRGFYNRRAIVVD